MGDFSVGALAVGKYFALGDNAKAMIALGDTEAAGSILQKVGKLTAQDIDAVKKSLDTIVPSYLAWAKELIKQFYKLYGFSNFYPTKGPSPSLFA